MSATDQKRVEELAREWAETASHTYSVAQLAIMFAAKLTAFAKEIREEEREGCAVAVEKCDRMTDSNLTMAAAIRARKEKP